MNLFSRFLFFFTGVFIGVVIIFLSLKNREQPISFNYFPNNRVKNFLIKSDIKISSKALCKQKCYELGENFLNKYINISKVDFKKSKSKDKGQKKYYLSSDKLDMIFMIASDSIYLSDIIIPSFDCNCN